MVSVSGTLRSRTELERPLHLEFRNEKDQQLLDNIRICSKEFLGFGIDRNGLDRQKKCQLSEVLESKDISVNGLSTYHIAVLIDRKTSNTQTQSMNITGQLGITAPILARFSTSVTYDRPSQSESTSTIAKVRRMVRHFAYCDCSLKDLFQQRKDFKAYDSQQMGNAFVRSCRVSTGYQLSYDSIFKNNTGTTTEKSSGTADVSLLGVVKLDASAKNISESRDTMTAQGSVVEYETWGGYTAPPNANNWVSSEEEASACEKKMFAHFIESLPSLKWGAEIRDLGDFVFNKPYPRVSVLTDQVDVSLSRPPLRAKLTFFDLAERIEKALGSSRELFLNYLVNNHLNLYKMLSEMNRAFKSTLNHMPQEQEIRGCYTEVIGYTGVGKSLLIRFLLGDKISANYDHNGTSDRLILDFCESNNSESVLLRPRVPKVGHLGSETVGCGVYGSYIDPAGLLDTKGEEARICNAIAISMITRHYSPTRLIVVIEPSYFSKKGDDFFKLIKTLKRCVTNLTHPDTLSSILFIVNDRTKFATARSIKSELQTLIDAKKSDFAIYIKTYAPKYSEYFLKILGLTSREELPELNQNSLGQVSQEINNDINEKMEEIRILKFLFDKEDQFLIADFYKPDTKNKIEEWQATSRTGLLEPNNFNMEDLVDGGYQVFRTVIMATTSYFNRIFQDKEDLHSLITEETARAREINTEISRLGEALNAPRANSQNLPDLLAAAKSNKIIHEATLQGYKITKEENEEKRNDLSSNEYEMDFEVLTPLEPIEPRPWWAYLNSLAKTYKFEKNTGGNPKFTNAIEKRGAEKDGTELGEFIPLSEEVKKRLDKGHYVSLYRPKYHISGGYTRDSTATVTLKVKVKDNPSTFNDIATIENTLHRPVTGLVDLISKVREDIQSCETDIQNYQNSIDWSNDEVQRRKDDQASLKQQLDRRKLCETRQKALSERYGEIEHEIDSFKDFYTIISRAVNSPLIEEKTTYPSEQVTLRKFRENVASLNYVKG
jgi:hypothetical protein